MERSNVRFLAVLLLVCIAVGSILVHKPVIASPDATTWYIAPNGNDGNSCLSSSSPCQTIMGTQEKASNGDTLVLANGTYNEYNIRLEKSLTIRGNDRNNTIIDGQSQLIFWTYNTVTFNLSKVTLQNGYNSSGGAISNHSNSRTTIQDVTIKNNRASIAGGAIHNTAQLTLTNSIISNNSCPYLGCYGGAIDNGGKITITNSAIINNSAYGAGGINNTSNGQLNITNTTIGGNIATTTWGGGVNTSGITAITNSTIHNNTAPALRGGGIFYFSTSSVSLVNTIIAGNSENCRNDGSSVTIQSSGYNLEDTNTCNLTNTGDKPNTNPGLGSLQENGGNTLTYALQQNSPAINAGNNAACPTSDQRNFPRPFGPRCDIGSFEFGAEALQKPIIIWIHGYQGFGSTQFYSSDPVVKYDPQLPRDKAYADMMDWLYQDGYDVWMVHYDSGPNGTAHLNTNAQKLADQLNIIRSQNPNRRYILIAHSMGGLVARAYLESNLYRTGDVESLFTLGSPHQGVYKSSFLTLCRIIPKIKDGCNLSTQRALVEMLDISDFNNTYSQRAPGVKYYLSSGSAANTNLNAIGKVFSDNIPGEDDGLIQASSSGSLNNNTGGITTIEVHHNTFGYNTYYSSSTPGVTSLTYDICVQPILQGGNCTSAVKADTSTAPTTDLTSITTLTEGQLNAQQVVTTAVELEGGPALFNASWSDNTAQFTLISPSGLIINPIYAQANPSIVGYKSYGPGEIPVVNYYVFNAEAGLWTLKLQGDTTNAGQYALTALVNSATTLSITPSSDDVEIGKEINLQVNVTNASSYTQTFTINKPDGSQYTTTNPIIMTDIGGIYTVDAKVEGVTTGGKNFERFAVTYFRASKRSYLPLILR